MEKQSNIIIVDDHQLVLDGIKSMLSGQDKFRIIAEALSGEAAFELIQSNTLPIDIVVTDISMKGMSGIELCQKIKNAYPALKVLILTMHNNVDFIKKAISCETDGYLLKSSGKPIILNALQSIVDNGCYYGPEIIPILYQETNRNEKRIPAINLSSRETEVLRLILEENTSKAIAEKLFISKQTVDSHRINIMEKTGSKSIVGLIKFAMEHHLA
ncbi:MAG: response regulator transcription factor [Flavobacterium sp.]|nr:response regulator transcription factor [Flavobacterium sp.]